MAPPQVQSSGTALRYNRLQARLFTHKIIIIIIMTVLIIIIMTVYFVHGVSIFRFLIFLQSPACTLLPAS